MPRWQKQHHATDATLDRWRDQYADHTNTGLLTRLTPTLDTDLLNPEAAKAVEQFLRKRFKGKGTMLRRVGLAPKFAIPFRTDEPFKKISGSFVGTEEKFEFLGDGQQFVVAGIHPDTKKPYQGFGGEPGEVARDELPLITGDEARQLVIDLQELVTKFGYVPNG